MKKKQKKLEHLHFLFILKINYAPFFNWLASS